MFIRSFISTFVLFQILYFNTDAATAGIVDKVSIWGYNKDYYVSCNTTTRLCVGTQIKAKRTLFEMVNMNNRLQQLKVVGKNLCLNVWWGTDNVNLFACTDPKKEAIKSWEYFSQALYTKSDGGRFLSWKGEGKQLKAIDVDTCFDEIMEKKDECAWFFSD